MIAVGACSYANAVVCDLRVVSSVAEESMAPVINELHFNERESSLAPQGILI